MRMRWSERRIKHLLGGGISDLCDVIKSEMAGGSGVHALKHEAISNDFINLRVETNITPQFKTSAK